MSERVTECKMKCFIERILFGMLINELKVNARFLAYIVKKICAYFRLNKYICKEKYMDSLTKKRYRCVFKLYILLSLLKLFLGYPTLNLYTMEEGTRKYQAWFLY